MRQLVLTVILSCLTLSGFASHIVGGEIFYDHLGGTQYQVTVKLYRDCLSDGAQFDQNLPITVFNGNGAQIDQFTIPFPGSTQLPVQFSNPCVTIPTDICVEEAVYTKVVNLPASSTGWTLSYQRCCRGPNVTNLVNPSSTGLTLTVDIPAQSTVASNSSPRFNNFPPLLLCANDALEFDHAATDPDGDSLAYSLCTPYHGGSDFDPAPNPSTAPPYTPVTWEAGISATSPFTVGNITLDPVTGFMIAAPGAPGLYAVGVCVSEYRNGVLIGTSTRDFLFRVMNCEIELAANMVAQENLVTFESYCQGLTVDFENNSFGGTNYQWDFGVAGITTDVSTSFEPSYTYPADGTYTVTLIVNPGWPCSDTAVGDFTVNNQISAFFEPPATQCVLDNSFDFAGQGTFPAAGSTFNWNFGSDATPGTSTDLNPTDIVYATHGTKPVTFTVYYDQCEASYTDNVLVSQPPQINLSIPDELKCVPYTAQFTNLSTASTTIYSLWDFGDGTTSNVTSPSHVYDQVGLYDVSLTIWTTTGCIDTLSINMPNAIEVFPRPTAQFSVTPYEQLEYDNEFFFTDESDTSEVVESWFYFADGNYTDQDSVYHSYLEPGVYLPWQIVKNEYGCTDKVYGQIKIIPILDVMVPNAFTPDGNSINNIFKPVLFDEKVYELWIYNRWGEQIHYEKGIDASWDGSYNGTLVPSGVYIWKMKYTSFKYEDIPVEKQGHVILLR
ncbi:PKD domain-containing protein [Paracrocinitomix mangrovi]|uniref:PKD domain-containing protein n=1 Tax=Paracrocinitomix mangrovi TaxID=2862509 RepID=UPI001C8CFE1C|nr:PKD domain-containing protein [Paracrocinitomix mangrovi]UKN00787.1 PKD domain-containing protein [Paracrocinitomix mangrovi]